MGLNWSISVSHVAFIHLKIAPGFFTLKAILMLWVLLSAWKMKQYNHTITPLATASLFTLLDFKTDHVDFAKHECVSQWAFFCHLITSFLKGKKSKLIALTYWVIDTFLAWRGWRRIQFWGLCSHLTLSHFNK